METMICRKTQADAGVAEKDSMGTTMYEPMGVTILDAVVFHDAGLLYRCWRRLIL
jgi:hypothetical protein